MKREIVSDNGDGTVTVKDIFEVDDPVFVVGRPEWNCKVYPDDERPMCMSDCDECQLSNCQNRLNGKS